MATKVHPEYYAILDKLIRNGKKFSQSRPWPNPTVAVMRIYGWVERTEPNGDWIVITDVGRKVHADAEVCS